MQQPVAPSGLRWLSFDALLEALRALTIIGAGRAPTIVDASAVYYPLVGLLLGAALVAADRIAVLFTGRFTASLLVLLTAIVATRGAPLLDLSRVLAAAVTAPRRPQALALMEAPAGSAVRLGALVIGAVELACLYKLDRFRTVGLLFAPMLARCAMVVMAVGSRAARLDGKRVKFAPDLTFNEFALATTLSFAVVFLATEFLGLLLVLATAALTIALRVLFHRWLDGINHAALNAICEATQLLVLAALALF